MSSREGQRKPKTLERGCPEREAVNLPKAKGAPSLSSARVAENPHGTRDLLMEGVAERGNMKQALKRVEQNQGAAGVDGMEVGQLRSYLRGNWADIKEKLLEGTYKPKPVKRVEIPKPGGGRRLLGIPTVLDRLIQQALLQVLTPVFDPGFSEWSYGFRPGRSAHQAVKRAKGHIEEGYEWVVDMDLEKFFDRVNHDILMSRVARKVKDKRVLKVIRAYLAAGVMVEGVRIRTEVGTPQGGPLSPLLANVMLDDLDKELEKRGHRFVRYADDCNIYVRSERAGQRVMSSVAKFLEKKLKLKVNRKKSGVDKPQKRKMLGFSFWRPKGETRLRLAPETEERLKEKIRRYTRRTWGVSMEERLKQLNIYLTGWMSYYHIVDTPGTMEKLDRWIRRRLKMCLLKQWKEPKTRRRKLTALGVPESEVHLISACRRGVWFLSTRKWVNIALCPSFWKDKGYASLSDRYYALRSVS
jgi:group II intron reverse transcriptase/maturase